VIIREVAIVEIKERIVHIIIMAMAEIVIIRELPMI
jgi:hypothetical protein